jgi:dTDP-4-dehydrorhamnose 3,5-epimerase
MKAEPTIIADCFIVSLDRHDDERGFFVELFRDLGRQPWAGPWLQANCSRSGKNVVRGLHVAPYAKLVTCVSGRAYDVVVDLRPSSPSYRKWTAVELSPANARQVYIPASCGHGFMSLEEDTTLVYLQAGLYDASRDRTVHWRDSSLGIEWPAADRHILSAKDDQAPRLEPVSPGGARLAISVESICNGMARGRLMPPTGIRSMRQRWLQTAGGAGADPTVFTKWMVANGHVTEYQAAVLLGRRQEPLLLGPYTIQSRMVQGPMAGVYKAAHTQGQVVALKLLPPSRAADPETLARFRREARLAVRLQHPNVVRAFQVGEENGLHYLVMEYLEGETLKDVLQRRGRLPAAEAIRLIYQALLGLQHIHEKDMVHRDLEPGNLMLIPADPGASDETTLGCSVKILDIGLGRALFDAGAGEAGEQVFVTVRGDSIGTPNYRSPEQARDAHAADIRSDLYSLGCVFYHALVGDPPFLDKNLVRLLLRHASEPPSPLQAFRIQAPEGLQKVLDGLLAKDPALRYPTPERAAHDLRAFLR